MHPFLPPHWRGVPAASSASPSPRPRWRVLACDVAEQHEDEIVYRVRVHAPEHTEPTYVFYVSQPLGRDVPHDVGGHLELDSRLLEQE